MDVDENSKSTNVRAVVEQIWYRARINAFAHREAGSECTRKSTRYFVCELVCALLSIFSVIVVYQLSTQATKSLSVEYLIAGLTLTSILFTLCSLAIGVMANVHKFDVSAAEHRYLLNSYQYIAQRAREVKWPDMPYDDLTALLKDLDRDFQLLKVRGHEPEDRHFEGAHRIVDKIRSNPEIRVAQSFEAGFSNRLIVEANASSGASPQTREPKK